MHRSDFEAAAEAGIITQDQALRLVAFFRARGAAPAPADAPAAPPARFDVSHLLWYAGALIVIGALSLFTTFAFEQMGPKALTITALAYGAGFVALGGFLWRRPGLRTPAGLIVACAVAMTPMVVYGIQAQYDLWPMPFNDPGSYSDFFEWMNASWVYMDVATILAGILAIRFFPFPFIAAIVAYALWFLSMDLTPWIFHTENFTWEMRDTVSMWFGVALIAVAWVLDLKKWRAGDFAFWLHLCGVVAFWGGLSVQDSDNEMLKAVYCLINVGLMVLAVFLMRRVYAVFGAIGVSMYLGYLAEDVFRDSLLFPMALSAIGLAIIGLGIWYFRRRHQLALWMATVFPPQLQKLRPIHAREAA
ncbi:MAG TPA: hypothetical protein VGM59_18600 [Dongiaceae bacterium]